MKTFLLTSLAATAGLAVLSATPAAAWTTHRTTAAPRASVSVTRPVIARRTAVVRPRPAYAYAPGYGPMWPGYAPYRAAYAPFWGGAYGAAYAPPFGEGYAPYGAPYGGALAAAPLGQTTPDMTAAVIGNHTVGHDPDPNVRENMIRQALS